MNRQLNLPTRVGVLLSLQAAVLFMPAGRQAAAQDIAAHGSVPVWLIEPTPEWVFGASDGPEPSILVNPIDAITLEDSTVVVGMFLRNFFELRYVHPTGVRARAGRFGEGPFEVSTPYSALGRMAGDSVIVISEDNRYSIFGPRGERARSGRLALPAGASVVDFLDGARILLRSSLGDDRLRLQVADAEGGGVIEVARLQAARTILDEGGLYVTAPFESLGKWAASGACVWYGSSGRARIDVLSVVGGCRAVDLGQTARRVTRGDAQAWRDNALARVPERLRARIETAHRRLDFPEEMPLYQDLRADAEGRLWVQEYQPPWSTEDYRWLVFDSTGAHVADAVAPFSVLGQEGRPARAGIHPVLEIGHEHILVRSEDAGVPRLERFAIRRLR